ncbi:hypothetical protein [Streptomyces sp. IBSBF 3136]|uniref:hypothetical protein n=1 Tax=Streptomyces sp. IBSBF 3136 TaxID=2903524 RepID=UPI003FA7360B
MRTSAERAEGIGAVGVGASGARGARTPSGWPSSGRKLVKHRILIVRGRVGNYNFYRISPYIAFHGTGLEQREAVKTCNPPDIPGFDDNVPARWEAQ